MFLFLVHLFVAFISVRACRVGLLMLCPLLIFSNLLINSR